MSPAAAAHAPTSEGPIVAEPPGGWLSVPSGQPGGYGPQNPSIPVDVTGLAGSWVLVPEDMCYCPGWYKSKGTNGEYTAMVYIQWINFVGALLSFLFQCFIALRFGLKVASGEMIFLMAMLASVYGFFIWKQFDSPVVGYMGYPNGSNQGTIWNVLQYQIWTWGTPAILIYLSNPTNRKTTYTKMHLTLLLVDCIAVSTWNMNGAAANFWVKLFFAIVSTLTFLWVYYLVFYLFTDAKREVTTARLRTWLFVLSVHFHVGWNIHTLAAAGGWEGLGFFNFYQTQIVNCIGDTVAKISFSVCATIFRLYVQKDMPEEPPEKVKEKEMAAAALAIPLPPPRNKNAMYNDEDQDDLEYQRGVRGGSVNDDDIMSQRSYNTAMVKHSPPRGNPLYISSMGGGQPRASISSTAQDDMVHQLMAQINNLKNELKT